MKKRILITGATSGIGRATALRLAEPNTEIIITGRRKERLEALKAEVEAKGAECLTLHFDVRSEAECIEHLKPLGRVDILVNNAAIWRNWSKFEENGYLHASNMIVYGGNMSATFSDMNDMPRNTICQLDLNLDGRDAEHTLANHPAPGVSCVAMCYAFSYTASHGKVQTVFTIDGRLYWRYGYTQSADDYRWTSWRLLTKDVPAIPEAPDTDGTYVLRCTVSNGTKTYTWVSV